MANKRVVRLSDAVPEYLLEYAELLHLYKAEDPEFQGYADTGSSMLDEMFIQTATDVGLSRYEGILGIGHGVGESLETRRSAVMTRWNDVSVYTLIALRNRIIAVQGNSNVEVYLSPDDPYTLIVNTHMESPGQVDNLAYILETMVPANMQIFSRNDIEGGASTYTWYGAAMSGTGTLFDTDDLEMNPVLRVLPGFGGAGVATETLFLTDDLKTSPTFTVEGKIGFGPVVTGTIFLTNDLNAKCDLGGAEYAGATSSVTHIIEIH